jgi:transglutaminase-like putative cysteine protease
VESSEPPTNTGDLYLDLARGGKGLCRHRAYGFVVTARALGIHARFVQNEAHSWVEVQLPDVGFLRIDLGGATHGLTAHDTRERASYVPTQPDTLPRPAAYRQSYARAARDKAGTEAPQPEALASMSGRWLPDEATGNTSHVSNANLAANGGEAASADEARARSLKT